MDIVYIKDLEVETVIGAYEWEKQITQTLVVDIEMSVDISAPAATDSLSDLSVDYHDLAQLSRSFIEESQTELIEPLALGLANVIEQNYSPTWFRLKLEKPRPKSLYRAGLVIERGERPRN